MLSSIKARVLIFYVAVLFMILPVLGIFLYLSLGKIVYESIDSSLLSRAKALATLVSNENGETQFNFSDEIMWEYNSPKAKNFFQIRYTNGTTIEKSRSLKRLELPLPPSQDRINYQTIHLEGLPARLVNFRFKSYGEDENEKKVSAAERNASSFIVQCAQNIDQQVDLLQNYGLILSLSIFSIMIISGAGGFFIAKRALSPIRKISETIKGISESNLAQRISTQNVPKELRGLAVSFNQTFDRLEKSFKRQKQFVSDASHELRTPLSVILSQSEVTLRKERSTEEYKNALTAIGEATGFISEIVGKLLTLARLGSDKIELKMEPTDLGEVIRKAVKVVTPLATRKGVIINFAEDEKALVRGDRVALLELFVNVLDNAIKYNVKDGKIDTTIAKQSDFIITQIKDTGIGISGEDLDKVFDRFYRADKSRSKQGGGIGLGLSICEEIVKLHGGRIEIKSQIGTGTTVSIYLKNKIQETGSPTRKIALERKTMSWPFFSFHRGK
jgi:heavy metal sensor kinase